MFEGLSQSLDKVFRTLRGRGKLSEANIAEAMRDVRMALLEADVNFKVARDFVGRLKGKCLGQEVLSSITPGQQVVKLVHDELVHLMGDDARELDMGGNPARLLLLGLHGSGKTTTAGKLAQHLLGQGRKPLLVAGDIRRPAAVDQLKVLAGQVGVPVVGPREGEALADLGRRALGEAPREACDTVLFDTGGRFQIDEELLEELAALQEAVSAANVLLVVDAALGQESVDIAKTFHDKVGLTGLILTKLDGDARGGAALSIHAVTGCPVLFTGTGETIEDLEPFYPDRMASRILGMGDIVSLVEKAQGSVDEAEMERMQERLRRNRFDLDDFLSQLQQMKRMGSVQDIMGMLPLPGNMASAMVGGQEQAADEMDAFTRRAEAIILSMTPRERRNPKVLNGSRRKRIAAGSGTRPSDVNELIRRFDQAGRMARMMRKSGKGLKLFK